MIHDTRQLSPRRSRHRQAQTERILAAAMRLLAEEGLSALTVHRLAADLDLTVGALYRYFPSKDELLAQVERHVVEEVGALVKRTVEAMAKHASGARAEVQALSPLLALAAVYRRLPTLWPERFSLVSQDLASPAQLVSAEADAHVTAALMPILENVAELFEGAASRGALARGDAGRRAMAFWAGMHGSTQVQKLTRLRPGFYDPQSLVMDSATAMLAGWGAPPTALQEAGERAEALAVAMIAAS